MRFYTIFLLIFCLVYSHVSFAQTVRKKVKEGNQLYSQEHYDEALNKYRDAQVQDPESPLIKFNIGNAQYKKKKLEEAFKEFESSLITDNVLDQAKTYYNIGNTLYRMGKLPESILAYQKSLELNPDDEDAKYNLEFVRKQLKDQADKQQQNPENQQQQQQQKQQQNQDQQQQEQQNEQQQQSEENQEQENQEQEQQQPVSPEDISKEDAERILNALEEDEENLQDTRKQKVPASGSVSKDW